MIKKLMMLCIATMAATLFPQVLKAEMQIGLTGNYAYSEGSVKIDGRNGARSAAFVFSAGTAIGEASA